MDCGVVSLVSFLYLYRRGFSGEGKHESVLGLYSGVVAQLPKSKVVFAGFGRMEGGEELNSSRAAPSGGRAERYSYWRTLVRFGCRVQTGDFYLPVMSSCCASDLRKFHAELIGGVEERKRVF